MGAGTYAAGVGPAGFDPVGAWTVRSTSPAVTPLFDPYTRDFPFAPTGGDFLAVHVVVQEACLALGIPLGSMASAPKLGIDVKRIRSTRAADIPAVCRDEVERCLSRLIERKDLRIKEIRAEAGGGRVGLEVDIVNLRDPENAGLAVTLRGSL